MYTALADYSLDDLHCSLPPMDFHSFSADRLIYTILHI